MHSLLGRYARKISGALLCAAAFAAAGCHNNNLDSGYGIGFVTLTDEPGDFASYTVIVDSVTLTGKTVGVYTAVATPETVDFTKLSNIAELWDTASIPNDTYTQATITLDYTDANISVLVNGEPQAATVLDSTGAAATTISVTVNLDPVNQLTIVPTYATTDGQRLALDFDLAASNVVNLATSPATVTVKPFFTVATSAPDYKAIRVRGPLINSSVTINTYTVYVRPFYDEENSLGSLSMFNYANTSFLIDGVYYAGSAGVPVLSQLSAGTTMTAAYTTYEPTVTTVPGTTAAKFNSIYVIAGSTLEDFYTQGLEGDVVARDGNTLTLIGSTLSLNDGSSQYNNTFAQVLLGSGTIVTADNNPSLTGLNYNSISVGQHIVARGIYELPASGVVTLDATGTSSTNTGSVRLLSTQLWGSLVSSGSGSLVMNLQTIDNWPVSSFYFSGNGVQNPVPANYVVNTGSASAPAAAAGDPLWVQGVTSPFGVVAPDFLASAVYTEATVQVAPPIVPTGTPAPPAAVSALICGQGNMDCVPASMQVSWSGAGTTTPFATLTAAGGGSMSIDLGNANYSSGVIRIGPESIDLKSLAATPTITPVPTPAATPGLPAVFLPLFAVGNPVTAAVVGASTTASTSTLNMYNSFATFVTQLGMQITAADPVVKFAASGVYNRASNTFTASRINVVL